MASDGDAQHRLILSAEPLVKAMARRFRGRGLPTADLRAEAWLAIVEAATIYRGDVPFPDHARPIVRAAVRGAILANDRVVGCGEHAVRLRRRYRRAERLLADYAGQPMPDEVASLAGLSSRQMAMLATARSQQRDIAEHDAIFVPATDDRDPVVAVRIAMATALDEPERAAIRRAYQMTGAARGRDSGATRRLRRRAEQKIRDHLAG